MTRLSRTLIASGLAALAVGSIAMPSAAQDRMAVEAQSPAGLSVTVYRDPNRGERQEMNRDWPRGFAMISEQRRVTLPPGRSTIRFDGVAEGMVAVTAIVTGLPGGTIEKNRNADLLSPASLVDGSLGNRVQITRTDPATGAERTQDAIIRTRADGGIVLQTAQGFEAVRCSGVPERLVFDRVPDGLSANPVFSIDTFSETGGTYDVVLTYLAWGFDWQAHYVATLDQGGAGDDQTFRLLSWLTMVNDNGQSFADADLMAVAGKLQVQSDYRSLGTPPTGRPLSLVCYPLGSTAEGSQEVTYGGYPPPPPPPPPPPAMAAAMMDESIVVTGARSEVMEAEEEDLGDLKLYRVPERVTLAAQSVKQIAFLNRDDVTGERLYRTDCSPWNAGNSGPVDMILRTMNEREDGLGAALPTGQITIFERSASGELLVGEDWLRDHAVGQKVDIALGESAQVRSECSMREDQDPDATWRDLRLRISNANPWPARVQVRMGSPRSFTHRRTPADLRVEDGQWITEIEIRAQSTRNIVWQVRNANVP